MGQPKKMDPVKQTVADDVKTLVKHAFNGKRSFGDEVCEVSATDVTPLGTQLRVVTPTGVRYFEVNVKESY